MSQALAARSVPNPAKISPSATTRAPANQGMNSVVPKTIGSTPSSITFCPVTWKKITRSSRSAENPAVSRVRKAKNSWPLGRWAKKAKAAAKTAMMKSPKTPAPPPPVTQVKTPKMNHSATATPASPKTTLTRRLVPKPE